MKLKNWADASSVTEKNRIIGERWGFDMPDALWFFLGEREGLNEKEHQEIVKNFFGGDETLAKISVTETIGNSFPIIGQRVVYIKCPIHVRLELRLGEKVYPLYRIAKTKGSTNKLGAICFLE